MRRQVNFFTFQNDRSENVSAELESRVSREVSQILIEAGKRQATVDEIASSIVKGATLAENAKSENAFYVDRINRLGRKFASLMDRTFLLVSMPTVNSNFDPPLAVVQEADARHFQFDNFLNAFKEYQVRPDKNPTRRVSVHGYREFIKEIQQFVGRHSMLAKEAYIILNGHGCKSGMCFEDDKGGVQWDKVITDVEKIIKRRAWGPLQVPTMIHLVFAQCFAHCRQIQQSKRDYLNIISFTGPNNETTNMTIFFENGTFNIADSNHIELTDFAKSGCKKLPPIHPLSAPGASGGTQNSNERYKKENRPIRPRTCRFPKLTSRSGPEHRKTTGLDRSIIQLLNPERFNRKRSQRCTERWARYVWPEHVGNCGEKQWPPRISTTGRLNTQPSIS